MSVVSVTNLSELRALLAKTEGNSKALAPPLLNHRIRLDSKDGFVMPDDLALGEIECVVVGVRYVNAWYERPWRAGVVESPACWAVGANANTMSPDEKAAKRQADSCEKCPKNEWGSSSSGAGKACKNQIRLGLVTPDADVHSQVHTMTLPPTSSGGFIKLLHLLENEIARERMLPALNGTKGKVPVSTVVLRMSMDTKVTYAKVVISVVGGVSDGLAALIPAFMTKAVPLLDRGFDYE